MRSSLNWIESTGGPLVLVPRSSLWCWTGSTSVYQDSDYARACAVDEEIAAIAVGEREALVLGDEPDRTTIVTQPKSAALIVRWRWADSEESLISELFQRTDSIHYQHKFFLRAEADDYLLFDSAYSGSEAQQAVSVKLEAGIYSIGTSEFRPDANTWALIHRIELQTN